MPLWSELLCCLWLLRPACGRLRTFLWMALVLIGLALRPEIAGVTSFVRALGLKGSSYRRLLWLFHTPSLDLDRLTGLWVGLVLRLFSPLSVLGRPVLVADGLKAPKEGRKMPAVKKLHQESSNNSKPEFIWGHSFQALGLLVLGPLGQVFCVPLASRIHEGLVFNNRDRRTLLDKLVALFLEIARHVAGRPLLLADGYYASRKVIRPLVEKGYDLVSRLRKNAVAYWPAAPETKVRRGPRRTYGQKVKLWKLFDDEDLFTRADSPVYGEKGVVLRYRSVDLLWRRAGRLVRMVLVDHPSRGRLILLSTCLDLDALQVISLYGYRFKIEVGFRQAVHTIGAYAYHFWMKAMTPRPRRSGNQFLHKKSDDYRRLVRRKIDAYHRFVQLAAVAQGLQQHLALNSRRLVWRHFNGWMRTMTPAAPPSEAVVAHALRNSLPELLALCPKADPVTHFLLQHADPARCPALKLAG